MKRPRSWSIVGLLCLSGAIGCAQIPSRGSFVRRGELRSQQSRRDEEPQDAELLANVDSPAQVVTQPSADQEAIHSTPFDSHVADRTPREDVAQDNVARDNEQPQSDAIGHSTGGHFDVSHLTPLNRDLEPVEAPAPRRRPNERSSPALVAGNIDDREWPTNSNVASFPPNLETDHPASPSRDSNEVLTTNYQKYDARSVEPQVRQIAATRTLADNNRVEANPWNRFQGLLNEVPAEEFSDHARQTSQTTISPTQPAPPAASVATQPAPWGSSPQSQPPQPFVSQPDLSPRDSLETWPYAPANEAPHRNAVVAGASNAQMPAESWPNSAPGFLNSSPNPGFRFPPSPNPLAVSSNDRGLSNPRSLEGVQTRIAPPTSSSELDRLITQTALEAAALQPGDTEFSRQLYLRKHVQLRFLYLIAGQVDRALQPVVGIEPADQEFWQQMLWGIANYFDTQGMPDSAERATQTIIQLRAAAARLQERARLELRNVTLCHRISGFGNYERFRRDEFTAGQPVLLYAEVIGFKSEPTPDGQFRSVMKSTIEIVEAGPSGRIVESIALPPTEDLCRNQRRDYYHSYEFAIPQNCQPGKHTLHLRVEDQLSKKLAVSKLNFMVQ